MTEIYVGDSLTIDAVIRMMDLLPSWNCGVCKHFPFFKRGNSRVREIYCNSHLSVKETKDVVAWYESNLNENEYPWFRFKRFIVALSCEGVRAPVMMGTLCKLARHLSDAKANRLLMESCFVRKKLNPKYRKLAKGLKGNSILKEEDPYEHFYERWERYCEE